MARLPTENIRLYLEIQELDTWGDREILMATLLATPWMFGSVVASNLCVAFQSLLDCGKHQNEVAEGDMQLDTAPAHYLYLLTEQIPDVSLR